MLDDKILPNGPFAIVTDLEPSPEAPVPTNNSSALPVDPNSPGFELKYTLSGHRKAVSVLKYSPDGKLLASGGEAPHLAHIVTCLKDIQC